MTTLAVRRAPLPSWLEVAAASLLWLVAWFLALPASTWLAFDVLGLDPASQLGQSVAFFLCEIPIEGTTREFAWPTRRADSSGVGGRARRQAAWLFVRLFEPAHCEWLDDPSEQREGGDDESDPQQRKSRL